MDIKVLLVDDEEDLAVHMAERLVTRGFSAEAVYDGPSAVDYVREKPVDVVVLDLQMPGMDGIETLKAVKEINPDLAVIMLTGYGTMETALEGKKMGAYEYLIKPCDIVGLAALIRVAHEKSSNGKA